MAAYLSQELLLDAVTPQPVLTRIGMEAVRAVRLTNGNQNLRYRFDGGLPTPTVGHLVLAGDSFTLTGADAIRQLRLMAVATNSLCRITVEAP